MLRVSPAGEGFVLYQMPKREVTAVAVARDGAIYAAAVGNKQPADARRYSPRQTSACPSATVTVNVPGPPAPAARRVRLRRRPRPLAPAGVSGGSEVYRIEPNGNPRARLEQCAGRGLRHRLRRCGPRGAGRGKQGQRLPHRIAHPVHGAADHAGDPDHGVPGGPRRPLYAATGNVGKVYEIGPGLEHEGTIESDVFDAGMYTLWGRLSFEAKLNGGQVAVRDAQRQPGPAAEELEPVVGGDHRDQGRADDLTRGAVRAMEGDPDGGWRGTIAGTGIGGRGLPAEERGAAHGPDRDDAAQLQVPGHRRRRSFRCSRRR